MESLQVTVSLVAPSLLNKILKILLRLDEITLALVAQYKGTNERKEQF